jgi:hypothetical protein
MSEVQNENVFESDNYEVADDEGKNEDQKSGQENEQQEIK